MTIYKTVNADSDTGRERQKERKTARRQQARSNEVDCCVLFSVVGERKTKKKERERERERIACFCLID